MTPPAVLNARREEPWRPASLRARSAVTVGLRIALPTRHGTGFLQRRGESQPLRQRFRRYDPCPGHPSMRQATIASIKAESPAVATLCGIQYPRIRWWWGGWGSNPRPRDYEVSQGPPLTCMIICNLPPDLRFHAWRPMVVDGPKRPFCGHRVGTVWARRVRIQGRGTLAHASRPERSGRFGGVLPAGLGARVGDAYTEPCLSR